MDIFVTVRRGYCLAQINIPAEYLAYKIVLNLCDGIESAIRGDREGLRPAILLAFRRSESTTKSSEYVQCTYERRFLIGNFYFNIVL